MVSHDDYKVPVRPDMLLVATFKKLDSTSTPSTHVMDMMRGYCDTAPIMEIDTMS